MVETLVARAERGCLQGEVLSLLLSNLAVNELLVKLDYEGHTIFGYADDRTIMSQGKFIVQEKMQNALQVTTNY